MQEERVKEEREKRKTSYYKKACEALDLLIVQAENGASDAWEDEKAAHAKHTVEQAKEININDDEWGKYILSHISELKEDLERFVFLSKHTFVAGDRVDVTGTSKGHGFSGTIAKWNFHRQKMSHGGGPIHRHVGSIGANTFPAKVFKGKKMAGRWGNERVTVQNLKVVKVDTERNILLIKGAIPGAKGSLVSVKSAVKVNG